MPRLEPVGKIPPLRAPDRPYRDDTDAGILRAGGGYSAANLQAASLPLLEELEGRGRPLTNRDIRPSAAQFESIGNALTNEISVQVNSTIAVDYSSMLPVVEKRDRAGQWREDKQVSREWTSFCSNGMQSHANMRLSLAHHILGAGQSYLYVENLKGKPWVQFMTPLAVKSKINPSSGRVSVFARVDDNHTNNDEELDPAGIYDLWAANPLTSLPGWKGAKPYPWTWLMPIAHRFETLRHLGRALDNMAVNRFLHNGILWFKSAPTIARSNPMGPAASISGAQAGPGSGGFGVGGPGGIDQPNIAAPGPNPFGTNGSPHADSGDHLRMVSASAPVDQREDARIYLRVIEKINSNPRSPAARAPFPVYWPEAPQFVQPEFKFDQHRLTEEDALLAAIARASPLPFDYVLSSGSTSAHWSRSAMRQEAIESSQQHADVFDGMIQTSLFRLWIEAAGENPEEWRIRSDVSPIATSSDISDAVKVGYAAGVVSDRGFLTVMGVPEEHWTKEVRDDKEGKNTNAAAAALRGKTDTYNAESEASRDAGGVGKPTVPIVPDGGTATPLATRSPDAPVGSRTGEPKQRKPAATLTAAAILPSLEVTSFAMRQACGIEPYPDEIEGW